MPRPNNSSPQAWPAPCSPSSSTNTRRRAFGRSSSASVFWLRAGHCRGRCSRSAFGTSSRAWRVSRLQTRLAPFRPGPWRSHSGSVSVWWPPSFFGASQTTAPENAMPNNNSKNEQSGRFAYDGLDRVIHERARLSVLTSLIAHPRGLVFGNLKAMCGLTDGNLSRHLQVLEEAKVIEINKGYDRNRPQTICRITARGRQRYLDYLKVLEQVVRDAAQAAKAGSASHVPAVGLRRLKTT